MDNVDFLDRFNRHLVDFECELWDEGEREIKHPFYFIIGTPRSGTTLLTQLLARCFDFGYICNLAARFWMAPAVGIRFAQLMLGDKMMPTSQSDYGRTYNLGDANEFGKFWMHCFGMRDSADVSLGPPHACSMDVTLHGLENISSAFKAPVVMKGIYPAYYAKQIKEWMGDKCVFVMIDRDPVDCCISIQKGRLMRHSGYRQWLGWHLPIEVREGVYELPYPEQIAHQVAYFRDYYYSIADKVMTLYELIHFPANTLESITGLSLVKAATQLSSLQLKTYDDAAVLEDRKVFKKLLEREGGMSVD